jgi:hypothetical protein
MSKRLKALYPPSSASNSHPAPFPVRVQNISRPGQGPELEGEVSQAPTIRMQSPKCFARAIVGR